MAEQLIVPISIPGLMKQTLFYITRIVHIWRFLSSVEILFELMGNGEDKLYSYQRRIPIQSGIYRGTHLGLISKYRHIMITERTKW